MKEHEHWLIESTDAHEQLVGHPVWYCTKVWDWVSEALEATGFPSSTEAREKAEDLQMTGLITGYRITHHRFGG